MSLALRPTEVQSVGSTAPSAGSGAAPRHGTAAVGPAPAGCARRGGSLRAALTPIAIMTLIVLAAPLLATHTALDVTSAGPFHAPSLAYPFGTDESAETSSRACSSACASRG